MSVSWPYLVYILTLALAFASIAEVSAEGSVPNGDAGQPTSVVTREPPPANPAPELPPVETPTKPPAQEAPTEPATEVPTQEVPTVSFAGAISFSPIGATSVGLQTNTTTGSATIIVSGDWDPCTTWTVDLSGTVNVPTETPAQLRAISINDESVTGEACDLAEGCDVIVLPATGNAASPLEYTIGLELQLHENTPVGSFGVDLQTEVHGEGTEP